MNRLSCLLVALGFGSYGAAVGGTDSAGTTARRPLEQRAAAYSHGTLEELGLNVLDGVDREEARRIAEWVVLGTVHIDGNRYRITSYAEPVSDGPHWRIDIGHDAAVPEASRRGPLLISKLSGQQSGRGWPNGTGPLFPLRRATGWVRDNGTMVSITLMLKRRTHAGDAAGQAELVEAVAEVTRRVDAVENGLFEKVTPADIKVVEAHTVVELAQPTDPNRTWTAQITLRPKK